MRQRRILLIEPYYGGSHKRFLTGLQQHVAAEYTLFSLPARKWKMRMQLSAFWFAEQVQGLTAEQQWFDTVLCSTFVDVAVLRALLTQLPGWNPAARFYTYFHENQYAYPEQVEASSGYQFAAINFTTALLSDKVAFNSRYNRTTFLENCKRYVNKAADMTLADSYARLERKCCVLHPGIDFSHIDSSPEKNSNRPPVIIWNHRWEHDKNPEEFFRALYQLQEREVGFRLILLGQSFRNRPDCFAQAEKRLRREIIHQGYLESVHEYGAMLKRGDIVVSTAHHEFFGISVLEAVRAGCRPLLPRRLAYPELFGDEFLYGEGELVDKLQWLVERGERLAAGEAYALTQPYSWQHLSDGYEKWLSAD